MKLNAKSDGNGVTDEDETYYMDIANRVINLCHLKSSKDVINAAAGVGNNKKTKEVFAADTIDDTKTLQKLLMWT